MLVLTERVVHETYTERTEPDSVPPATGRKYAADFVNMEIVTIPGTLHGLGTADLGVSVYERRAGSLHVLSCTISIVEATYDLTITLLQPVSGRVVLLT